MAYALTVTVPPTTLAIRIEAAREFVRADEVPSESFLLDQFIRDATQRLQEYLGRSLMTQTLTLRLDAFPGGCSAIELPRPPVQSISWVKYLDAAGVEQILDAGLYQLDPYSDRPRLAPVHGGTWPTALADLNAVRIQYLAGYATAEAVPPVILTALFNLVGALYHYRAVDDQEPRLRSAMEAAASEKLEWL